MSKGLEEAAAKTRELMREGAKSAAPPAPLPEDELVKKWDTLVKIDDLAARFIEATGDDAPPSEFAEIAATITSLHRQLESLQEAAASDMQSIFDHCEKIADLHRQLGAAKEALEKREVLYWQLTNTITPLRHQLNEANRQLGALRALTTPVK